MLAKKNGALGSVDDSKKEYDASSRFKKRAHTL
jgi:hypothetical protein